MGKEDLARANAADVGDRETIARIRAGDMAAFVGVFEANVDALCDLAFRYVRVRESAEEIVQEVFAHLWIFRGSLEITESVRAYLYRATRNRALNVLRRTRTEGRWEGQVAIDIGLRAEPAPAHSEAVEDRLREAIALLPERQRTVIEMRWLSRLSYTEIAHALGVTTKTVENHLTRALQRLRELLKSP